MGPGLILLLRRGLFIATAASPASVGGAGLSPLIAPAAILDVVSIYCWSSVFAAAAREGVIYTLTSSTLIGPSARDGSVLDYTPVSRLLQLCSVASDGDFCFFSP